MSVIPARRRRELARAVSGAGLAAALAGSTLVAGAMLPTAFAAVDPGDPIPGNLLEQGENGLQACQRLVGQEDVVHLYGSGGESRSNEFFAGTSDIFDNTLDVEVVDPDYQVLAVFVKGAQQTYNAFVGDPYLEGDDLLGMYAPEADGLASPLDDVELLDETADLLDEETAGLVDEADLLDERDSDDYGYTHERSYDKKKNKHKDRYPPKEPKINHWLVCGEKPDEPEPEPVLGILEPVCDADVPYLEYVVDPQGTDAGDGDVTITWINPDGDDVVYEDLPLAGRVLWVGAVTDEEGNPLDWPGWTQLEDGTWVEGDEFDWVRPEVDIVVSVNPDFELTVDYPPSSPICDANPPENPPEETLPETGSNALLAMAGGGLLLGGAALLLVGRRSARSKS